MTPLPSDQTAPGNPTLNTPTVTATSVSLTWSSVTDTGGSGLAGYKVYRQRGTGASLPVGTVTGTSFTDQPLQPSTGYTYKIVAFDNAQNHSSGSNSVNATTTAMGSDTTAPTVPPAASGSALAWNRVRISWQSSIDNGGSGVAGYKVYKAGNLISGASPITNLFFEDTTVVASTAYSYTVKAIDNATNASADTPAVQVTTPREIVFSDNFDRPTGAAFNWSYNFYQWDILNTQARFGTLYWGNALTGHSMGNFRATVTINASPFSTGVHFWGPDNFSAKYRVFYNGGYLSLVYYDGSESSSALYSGVTLAYSLVGLLQTPATLVVDATSSTRNIKAYWNGTLVINFTETDTSRPNSGLVGITAWSNQYANAMVDNFLLEK